MINPNPDVDMLVTALGYVIHKQRRRLGLSQDELAAKAGLHRTYVSEIERRSRNLSVKILVKLSLALELEPHELMQIAEERSHTVGSRAQLGSAE